MILCAGESLIDMVPDAGGFRPLAGGAVYNTAIALGRMGAKTGYLWPISRDQFGEVLLSPLAEAGVDTTLCPRSDRLTTLAFVRLKNGDARYSFYDEASAGRMFAETDLPDPLPALDALFIGGISLVPDPCGATVEALVARAKAAGTVVMIDPNIRPFFITDAPAYRERLTRLLAQADMVKLSRDDLDWLWPETGSEDVVTSLLNRGPKVVFVTEGGTGATAHTAGSRAMMPAERVTVSDTIGAGDTFNAGVLAALSRDGALTPDALAGIDEGMLRRALSLGIRAAAVTVSRPGANPPWLDELD